MAYRSRDVSVPVMLGDELGKVGGRDDTLFGKPIEQATLADVERLSVDGVGEGQYLEFKEAVPVSDEEQRRQAKAGTVRPFDQSVANGTGIGDFGRNSLLEELVAFANADGGVIVLGIEETGDKPARAGKIAPIPHIIALERRLRDAVNSLTEPRLAYVGVRALLTELDDSGVILIETERSSLGPHWVKSTRAAKIRREDRADSLSMPEIHDMALRNARGFEGVVQKLSTSQTQFESCFFSKLRTMCNIPSSFSSDEFRNWLTNNPRSFVGWRVTIVAHQNIGIRRLEEMRDLIAGGRIEIVDDPYRDRIDNYPLLFRQAFNPKPILGGMTDNLGSSERCLTLRVDRDGFVELSFVTQADATRHVTLLTLLSGIGSAIGSYECLRLKGVAPSMPAEIGVEILSLPDRCPMIGSGFVEIHGEPLDFRTSFSSMTISDRSSFDYFLNEIAADFVNAGGLLSAQIP